MTLTPALTLTLTLTLTPTLLHQVKRMLAHVGGKVDQLHRDRFGALSNLNPNPEPNSLLTLTLPLRCTLTLSAKG